MLPSEFPATTDMADCGGKQTCPLHVCNLPFEMYGFSFEVPVLIIERQVDPLIIGINVLKPLIRQSCFLAGCEPN